VRVERPGDRTFAAALAVIATVAGGVAGSLLWGLVGGLVGGAAGLVFGGALMAFRGARSARRRRLLEATFPAQWRQWLLDNYDHYHRLPDTLRPRFENDLRLFLAQARITGIGVEVSDDFRLMVATAAVTLSLGWPDYEWNELTEVLLYPDDFDRDYGCEKAELAGQAHPWGTIILSVPALLESLEDPDEPFHVGLHEFAHLLDMDQSRFDGIPTGFEGAASRSWMDLVESEMERLRRGKSALDPYGAEDPVEFLAVAVEAFFKTPLEVRRRHRELYDVLSSYFGQDPAAWDDERGLVLR
jgi:Mlc titration factor MtfA (ptsG expression regulator)